MTNLEEYLAGTDPNDPDSFLRIEAIGVGLGDLEQTVIEIAWGRAERIERRAGVRSVARRTIFCHVLVVNAALLPMSSPAEKRGPATTATEALLRAWVASCNEFRQRERREIIEQAPSPERLAEYREELKWMIRGARALLNLVSDPDFPAREFVPEISGKLRQLEDSWQSLNNPMTAAEADAMLDQAFPDEARTRSSA